MFFRPGNKENSQLQTKDNAADSGASNSDASLRQANQQASGLSEIESMSDAATVQAVIDAPAADDCYQYTEAELEALQNGQSIDRGPEREFSGHGITGDDSANSVPSPHIKTVNHLGVQRRHELTATERAAALLADQIEADTEVDKFMGAESFVLADPKKRTSNADAKWMSGKERWKDGFAWPIVIWMGVLHLGALIAIPFFTWQALIVTLIFHWIGGSVGVCLGFHRMLTHGGFKTYPWMKALLTFAGQTAGEGSADMWVATHRKHHAHSDKPGDPHSPHEGSWWSHMNWIYPFKSEEERQELLTHWAPDMVKDPVVSWVSKYFLATHFVVGFAMLGVGYLVGGWPMAVSFVMWGVFVRTVAVLHVTWFVNSASHMFGYRNYETTDDSKNNWWVAIVAYGEGWHNNHHAYPRMAVHGHKWWEFDATWQLLRLMKVCGLAWDIVDYRTAKEKREREVAKNVAV